MTPLALTHILLRFVGVALALWWLAPWVTDLTELVQRMKQAASNGTPGAGPASVLARDWWDLLPRPFRPYLWRAQPIYSALDLIKFFFAAYLLVDGKAAAKFLCRGIGPRHAVCANCGYSLRGNTSGTCPECGAPTKTE